MDSRKVMVRNTRRYGKALFAKETIRKGEIIARFDGQIMNDDFDEWTNDLYNHAIQFGKTDWRDSKGVARWANHSCDPNCGIKDLFKIVAMKTIRKGEEITWDYEMTDENEFWSMKCRCGSTLCRGRIGNYSKMPKDIRRKYKGFISEWLIRK